MNTLNAALERLAEAERSCEEIQHRVESDPQLRVVHGVELERKRRTVCDLRAEANLVASLEILHRLSPPPTNEAITAAATDARNLLMRLQRRGRLGLDVHDEIQQVIAKLDASLPAVRA